jgi:hypothetical protein
MSSKPCDLSELKPCDLRELKPCDLSELKPQKLKRCFAGYIRPVGSFQPCPEIVCRQTAGHVGGQFLQEPPPLRPWTLDDEGNQVMVDGT